MPDRNYLYFPTDETIRCLEKAFYSSKTSVSDKLWIEKFYKFIVEKTVVTEKQARVISDICLKDGLDIYLTMKQKSIENRIVNHEMV